MIFFKKFFFHHQTHHHRRLLVRDLNFFFNFFDPGGGLKRTLHDFLWARTALVAEHPGVVVPPITTDACRDEKVLEQWFDPGLKSIKDFSDFLVFVYFFFPAYFFQNNSTSLSLRKPHRFDRCLMHPAIRKSAVLKCFALSPPSEFSAQQREFSTFLGLAPLNVQLTVLFMKGKDALVQKDDDAVEEKHDANVIFQANVRAEIK